MTTAFLNGKFLPLKDAHISAMDRGFLFGDGVYEVIPVYAGRCFRLKEHLHRLSRNLQEIKLPIALDESHWENIFSELIKRNGGGNQSLYFQITRGPALQRDFPFPEQITPTFFGYSKPYQVPPMEQLEKGIKVITLPDERWQRCDIKAITLLASVIAREIAKTQNAGEAILINQGNAVEGASSNIFIVQQGTLITPPMNHDILGGITRVLILELARQHHVNYREQAIPEADLYTAEEVWITSSSREIQPVTHINDHTVSSGTAGPAWRQMMAYYQDYKKTLQ